MTAQTLVTQQGGLATGPVLAKLGKPKSKLNAKKQTFRAMMQLYK